MVRDVDFLVVHDLSAMGDEPPVANGTMVRARPCGRATAILARMRWTVHGERPLYQDEWLDIRRAPRAPGPDPADCRPRWRIISVDRAVHAVQAENFISA
jgi:hypothetical protein